MPENPSRVHWQRRGLSGSSTSDWPFGESNIVFLYEPIEHHSGDFGVGSVEPSAILPPIRKSLLRAWTYGSDFVRSDLRNSISFCEVDDLHAGTLMVTLLPREGGLHWQVMTEVGDSFNASNLSRVSSLEGRLEPTFQEQSTSEAESTSEQVGGAAVEVELQIRSTLMAAFAIAAEEIFEDGMDSVFSHSIHSSIWDFGEIAVSTIDAILRLQDINGEVAGEALRQLGLVEDLRTQRSRLSIIANKLDSADPRLRDAALLGLEFLDDPVAIPYLQRAVERENIPVLRMEIQQVLDQLRTAEIGSISEDC